VAVPTAEILEAAEEAGPVVASATSAPADSRSTRPTASASSVWRSRLRGPTYGSPRTRAGSNGVWRRAASW